MTELAKRRRRRRWYTYLGFAIVVAAGIGNMAGFDDLAWPLSCVGFLFVLLATEDAGWVRGYEAAITSTTRTSDDTHA